MDTCEFCDKPLAKPEDVAVQVAYRDGETLLFYSLACWRSWRTFMEEAE